RTVYGFQYQSFSKDGGKTWTVPEPALLFPSPDSPMRVNKLGAKVIAVFNPVGHSPYAAHNTPWGAPQRTPIMLAVSGDGGLSFAKPAKEFSWNLFNAHRQHCFLMEDDSADSYCYPAMIRVNGGYLVTYYCDAGSHRVLNCSHVVKITDEELTPQ
ncbi:MAG: exo-alpha-sialidase, partial [Clostridia bacterium]|nr:exo-alpha-sialidase [Clostridia bacterium]